MKTQISKKQIVVAFSTILFLLLTALYSCKKNLPETKISQHQTIAKMVSAGTKGIVLYEDGSPAANVKIDFVGYSQQTNENGEFNFESISCPSKNAMLQVLVDGYFPAYRSLMMTENIKEYVVIRLLKKELSKSFMSSEKADVAIRGGGVIHFEPKTMIIEKSGLPYEGRVNVYAAWINPATETLSEFLPGSLRGITLQNDDVNLESYGMIAVEMYSDDGTKLQLAKDKNAHLELPIANDMLASAPETMPLWSLDETTGEWKEESIAQKVGNKYIGDASHFSFWNLDVPGAIGITVLLTDSISNLPMQFRNIRITRLLNNTSRSGATNNMGVATGYILPNESYLLEVLFFCGGISQVVKSIPFTMGAIPLNMGNILIHAPGNTMVANGTIVDINNNPIPNTTITFKPTLNSLPVKTTTDNSGQFSFSVLSCTNTLSMYITAYDDMNLVNSGLLTYTLTPGIQNLGTITAHGELSEYVRVSKTIAGITQEFKIAEPHMNASCTYNNNMNTLNLNSFSNLQGIDWRFNFRIQGPLGINGNHAMTYFYELINGQVANTNMNNTIVDPTVGFTNYGTSIGSFISARKEVTLSNGSYRVLDFRVRKDN